jgi:septum site-determining protein MinC
MSNSISIKGTREGLTITLGSGDFDLLMGDLAQHLKTQGAFFRGGRVALELGDRAMEERALAQVNDLLKTHDMILRTVVTANAQTEQAAHALGLRLVAPAPVPQEAEVPAPSAEVRPPVVLGPNPLEGTRGLLVRHLVRSGQVLRHTGHVVVVGDVNVGAEIVAGGDIVVWGRLRGTAHAGTLAGPSAVVCALDLNPLQLRIGDVIARPGEDERPTPLPEVAFVRDNAIVVMPWDGIPRGV